VKPKRWRSLLLCCGVGVALSIPAPANADATPQTLRAVGNGVTFVTPDAATVTISVSRTGGSADAARRSANVRLRAILAGLRATGLPTADVQSSQISLNRHALGRPVRGRRQRFRYAASGALTVDTKRVALLSAIFSAASHAGADSFDGPNYRVSDPAAGALAAEAAAVRNARRRADSAAAAAGVRVIGIQSIDLDPSNPNASTQLSGSSGSAPSGARPKPTPGKGHAPIPTPTHPGKQEVDATVDVVFLVAS